MQILTACRHDIVVCLMHSLELDSKAFYTVDEGSTVLIGFCRKWINDKIKLWRPRYRRWLAEPWPMVDSDGDDPYTVISLPVSTPEPPLSARSFTHADVGCVLSSLLRKTSLSFLIPAFNLGSDTVLNFDSIRAVDSSPNRTIGFHPGPGSDSRFCSPFAFNADTAQDPNFDPKPEQMLESK
ncbi:hypothetical protein EVAR_74917_1 [Eumeta japonica]|uniref:Uncharacterized protein n=1 Tax=Eumeta variegata TaxID=151549 RepID=A0A4C1UIA3_EUMVA|nr:hypothetical protein EVAR_74917_1 [Eumeta japonica]